MYLDFNAMAHSPMFSSLMTSNPFIFHLPMMSMTCPLLLSFNDYIKPPSISHLRMVSMPNPLLLCFNDYIKPPLHFIFTNDVNAMPPPLVFQRLHQAPLHFTFTNDVNARPPPLVFKDYIKAPSISHLPMMSIPYTPFSCVSMITSRPPPFHIYQ